MIQIKKGKVFVEVEPGLMVETTNPELIGLAVLDFASDYFLKPTRQLTSKEKEIIKESFFNYIKNQGLRTTLERKELINHAVENNNFTAIEFVKGATQLFKKRVSRPTCYNFLETLVESNILEIQPKKYTFKL